MIFKQFRLADMGCASYLIGSDKSGKALVVDPGWEVEQYIKEAEKQNLRITHIFETHLHADHVSGNRRLAAQTGAAIYLHEAAGASFPHFPVLHGQTFELGEIRLRVLATPGHTWESITLMVEDTADPSNPSKLLSGDALFIGDVGRPDFAGQEGAGTLYDSLRRVILPLPDETELYPAHLAGSLCGRNMSSATVSTLAHEKLTNVALQFTERDEFVEYLTADLPPAPPDFRRIVELNRAGSPERVAGLAALSAGELQAKLERGVTVVDLREPEEFWQYQLPASINVPLSMGQFGANVASFVDISSPVVLLVYNENEARMAQVALGVVGRYELEGFVTAAEASRLLVKADYMRIEPEHLHKLLELESVAVLDVRQPAEFEQDSLPGAINLPLAQLPGRLSELEAFKDSLLVVTCAAGYRSSLASSFLTQQGWGYIQNLKGGMNGFNSWNRADRQAA